MSYLGSALHLSNLSTAREAAKNAVVSCGRCGKVVAKGGAKQHDKACSGGKNCDVCGKWFYSRSATCSHSCANKKFRTGPDHGNWKQDAYRSTCFHHHGKSCVVCGEENIVEVHHLDGDHQNNSQENLVPLCPTHHQYLHSRFRPLIERVVTDYVRRRAEPPRPPDSIAYDAIDAPHMGRTLTRWSTRL